MKEFRRRLKTVRKSLKLRQQDMSDHLSIPLSTISKYELGLIKPGTDVLAKISEKYNINLNWLLNGIGEMFLSLDVLESTGTYGKPNVKMIRKSSGVEFENIDLDEIESDAHLDSEESMFELSKKMNSPIVSELYHNNIAVGVKIYKPDGKVEEKDYIEDFLLANVSDEINKNTKLSSLLEKLNSLYGKSERQDLLKIAIDSLDNNDTLSELKKVLINGIKFLKND